MVVKLPNDQELELQDAIAYCASDLHKFVMFAFDWGNGALVGETGPDVWQKELLDSMSEAIRSGKDMEECIKILVKSGHGCGKTTLCCWLILWFMSTKTHPKGAIIATTAAQLRGTTWAELAKWHNLIINSHWFKYTSLRLSRVDNEKSIFFEPRSWDAHNTDAFQGIHSNEVLILFDEASAIDDKVWEVAEGATTTTPSYWIGFGNPTRNNGRFYDGFTKYKDHYHKTMTVDVRDAKKTNNKQLNQWIDQYGIDSDFVKVRVLGEFPNSSISQFIPLSLVEESMETFDRDKFSRNQGAVVLGVDVARFGDDKTCISLRVGKKIVSIEEFNNLDVVQISHKVSEMIKSHKPIKVFIDEGAMGAGVVDNLKHSGYSRIVKGVSFASKAINDKTYANKRCEIYGNLLEWLNEGGALPLDHDLKYELTAIDYYHDTKDRMMLEPKKDVKKKIGKSPDKADSVALCFSEDVASNDTLSYIKDLGVTSEYYDDTWKGMF